MRAEYLYRWIQEATQYKDPDATYWLKEVSIVQKIFRGETLTNESTWKTAVLIPRGYDRDLRDIGLVEVLWKTATGLLNRRFASAIKFHDFIYIFWADR